MNKPVFVENTKNVGKHKKMLRNLVSNGQSRN